MDTTIIVPAFDPIPLPAPVWLLKFLLLLTFTLHLVAMNLLVGGTWSALIGAIKSKRETDGNFARLYREMVSYLPTLIPATVTLGIAPLLFVQVLFGHLVYSSSIAIGWFWWTIIPLVIIAYYAAYYLKFHSAPSIPIRPIIIWIPSVILLWISFILSNNFNLAQQPERFAKLILDCPSGLSLNLSDHTTIPRWLHIMLGAVAVSGVWMMWLGRLELKRDAGYAGFKLNYGYKLFAYPTMVNILVGFVYMMTLPRDIMMRLMGKGLPETSLWLVGMGTAIWAIPVLKRGITAPRSAGIPLGTGLMTLSVISMILLRDLVRHAYIGKYFTLDLPKVDVMWGAIIVFAVTFVIGLWVMKWLIGVFLKAKG
jgi:hypothetical protein